MYPSCSWFVWLPCSSSGGGSDSCSLEEDAVGLPVALFCDATAGWSEGGLAVDTGYSSAGGCEVVGGSSIVRIKSRRFLLSVEAFSVTTLYDRGV